MKIKPNQNFHLLGTNIKLDKNKVYEVENAENQPNWKEKGLVFCEGVLLGKEDYTAIEDN